VRPVVRRLPAGRYFTLRWLTPRRPNRFVARLDAGASGLDFVCDLRDRIAREVCFTGRYGPQETWLFHALLAPNMTVVDVGANWGYFTLLAASIVGPGGRVLAIEPEPRLFALLEQNVRRNALDQVVAVRAAATGRPSTLTLSVFDQGQGNWGTSSVAGPQTASAVDVAGLRVDDLVCDRGISSVDLAKIDVEGHEPAVLAGMRVGLLEGRYRRVLIEWHPWTTTRPEIAQSFALLKRAGYRGWWIDHSPSALRAAAYGAAPRLTPVDASECEDDWPHTIWVAAGEANPTRA
jgi:FkbM family methyltransferase